MEEVLKQLAALGLDETNAKAVGDKLAEAGVASLTDVAELSKEELVTAGLKPVQASKLLKAAAPAPVAAAPVAPATDAATAAAFNAIGLLPQVPTDDAFLKLLQVGGTLKVEPTDVMSAVRVLFAQRYGVFEIEDRLLEAIENRANELEEPWPPIYFEVQKALARKAHADVLSALEISSARVFTKKNKDAFLNRLTGIWDDLASFQERAVAYQQNWMTKMSNPGMMMAMLRGAQIPGMDAAPDTTPIRSAATAVIDGINKKFAGPGIPVSRALAADALQLRAILEKPELVGATGAGSRDEMLKKLGISVTQDASLVEQTLTQYVLSVMKLVDVPPAQLPTYISAVAELGATVPWDTLRTRANGRNDVRSRSEYGSGLTKGGHQTY